MTLLSFSVFVVDVARERVRLGMDVGRGVFGE